MDNTGTTALGPTIEELQSDLETKRQQAQTKPRKYLPELAQTLSNLGVLHRNRYEMTAAQERFAEAVELRRKLAQQQPAIHLADLAQTLNDLAIVFVDTNKKLAVQNFEEALEIRRKLAQQDPQAYLADLAETLDYLATLYHNNAEINLAKQYYQETLKLRKELVASRPEELYQRNLSRTLNNLGVFLRDINELELAEENLAAALKLRRRQAQSDLESHLEDLCASLEELGILYHRSNRLALALEHYQELLLLNEKRAKISEFYLAELPLTLHNIAVLQCDAGELDPALENFTAALSLFRPLAKKEPELFLPHIARVFIDMSILFMDGRQEQQASLEHLDAALLILEALEQLLDVSELLQEAQSILTKLGLEPQTHIAKLRQQNSAKHRAANKES